MPKLSELPKDELLIIDDGGCCDTYLVEVQDFMKDYEPYQRAAKKAFLIEEETPRLNAFDILENELVDLPECISDDITGRVGEELLGRLQEVLDEIAECCVYYMPTEEVDIDC